MNRLSRPSRHSRVPSIVLSHLELRRLLAAWAPLEDGAWNIRGSDRADALTLEVDPDRTSMAILRSGSKVIQQARLRDIRSIQIDAFGGNDRVTVSLPRRTVAIRVSIVGGWGHDTLVGGGADDFIDGGLGNDLLQGRDGNDTLTGGHGTDTLAGEGGDDFLEGKLGADKLDGGAGRDLLDGGRDDDQLMGAGARDSLRGSAGVDDLDGGTGRDVLSGGSGQDRIVRIAGRDTVSDSTATLSTPSDITRFEQSSTDAFVQMLIDRAVKQYRGFFDHPRVYDDGGTYYTLAYAADAIVTGTGSVTSDSTNVQEAGVDEADTIETDGRYLYSLDGDELRILDLADAENVSVRSTTAIEGSSFGMYLLPGARLVVLSRHVEQTLADQSLVAQWNYQSNVRVSTYDVSNVAAPVELGHTDLDGYYADSRVIGNSVYVVTGQTLEASPLQTRTGTTVVNETEPEYRARLASDLSWIPSFTSSRSGVATNEGQLVTSQNTFLTNKPGAGFNFANVAVIDGRNAGNGVADSATIDGTWISQVYASQTAIYVAGTDWSAESATTIAKLAITESTVDLEANGVIDGRLSSQFALDEENGQLRAATTTGIGFDTASAVTVLEARGDTLEIVGQVGGIAPTEQIFSARFVGDKAYIVTFRQVDPFYVIDLSNPTAPVIAGELKIPGVSNYLQPINDRYILGIGRTGDDTSRLGGVQVSLFDVADPTAPMQVSTLNLSTEAWSSSVAQYNHHAVQYFADEGLLSLPVTESMKGSQQLVRVDLAGQKLSLEESIPLGTSADTRSVKIGETIFATNGHEIVSYSTETQTASEAFAFNPQANEVRTLCGWGWWFGVTTID